MYKWGNLGEFKRLLFCLEKANLPRPVFIWAARRLVAKYSKVLANQKRFPTNPADGEEYADRFGKEVLQMIEKN